MFVSLHIPLFRMDRFGWLAQAKGASMSPNVSEHKQDDNGPVAVFTCTDTGPGIPADARAKLFRAFTQVRCGNQYLHPYLPLVIQDVGRRTLLWRASTAGLGSASPSARGWLSSWG